jgi:hypothetical protein
LEKRRRAYEERPALIVIFTLPLDRQHIKGMLKIECNRESDQSLSPGQAIK